MKRVWMVAGALLLTLAAGCGGGEADPWGEIEGGTEGLTALVASSVLVPGENRIVVGVLRDGEPISDATVDFELFNLNGEPRESGGGELSYVPVEGLGRGYYVGSATFEEAGLWGMEVRVPGEDDVARAQFGVAEGAEQPLPGDAALLTESRTSADTPMDELTTDADPDPALYELTVAEAVSGGKPAVLAFASPALCQTQTCGPSVDLVKHAMAEFGSAVNFVHIEVYENLDSAEPTVVAAVEEWGLRTEPWIYVVDSEGIITAAFEGLVGEDELRAAIEEVAP